jgi:hypothetical protein
MLKADGCIISVSPCVVLLYSDYSRTDLATEWI